MSHLHQHSRHPFRIISSQSSLKMLFHGSQRLSHYCELGLKSPETECWSHASPQLIKHRDVSTAFLLHHFHTDGALVSIMLNTQLTSLLRYWLYILVVLLICSSPTTTPMLLILPWLLFSSPCWFTQTQMFRGSGSVLLCSAAWLRSRLCMFQTYDAFTIIYVISWPWYSLLNLLMEAHVAHHKNPTNKGDLADMSLIFDVVFCLDPSKE